MAETLAYEIGASIGRFIGYYHPEIIASLAIGLPVAYAIYHKFFKKKPLTNKRQPIM